MGAPVPVLEVGGTHVTSALVDPSDWRVVDDTQARRRLDPDGVAEAFVATLVDAADALATDGAAAWGVAIPGPFDYDRGIADFHGVAKFDGLRGVDLGDVLRRELTGGAGCVWFVNDAEAFAVGEWVAGAAFWHRRAIGVTLGTGVGSAFLVDGRAQRHGPGVPPQGLLHLLEIDGEPLEDTVSRRAIRARYAVLTGCPVGDAPDVRDIAALARAGDGDASAAVDEPLRALGRVLGPLAADFGSTILVVGGSISQAWDVIERPLRSGMDEAAPGLSASYELAPAHRLEEAALLGAARHAVNQAGNR